ncbi:hypothetical protein G647_00929 [Cladophialophora carrionii CBS 160.54]|uniref:Uncharacterized protein n=1 Tax=Cladophialophora carrionii CBS 160.54 TaxID=1279043 RepID=V9DNM5_9EURO|nr:uncharacterized protein G647_00929 [Cladophialophora carrionii CBS 160.54]ETI28480.1 hypothetical protein G647_00929 [Cladophialophora carrionii CBS 160.54]
MSLQGDSIFTHVRTKLRQSRSSVMLATPSQYPYRNSGWDDVPVAYRPVERAEYRAVNGYYLDRPLPGPPPGPPPRPRTMSPQSFHEVRASLDVGNLRIPTPRTHRTRSAEMAQRRWSGLDGREMDFQNKDTSVNIAVALPPDHLEPPPPYSRYDVPPATGYPPRPRSQPPPVLTTHYVKPYDPIDYIGVGTQGTRRPVDDVPIIAAPQPPTPVSPLNTLDLQYLAMRRRPASENNVTLDGLLSHPMLQQGSH